MNLSKINNVFFIGVGGIGMSALARYFNHNKKTVSGYDKTNSIITKELQEKGINVYFEDDVNDIPSIFLDINKTLIVYTPAIPDSHTQLEYFKQNNFNVLKRAEVLGLITKNTRCLAVAGTHGKTTTSSILGHIMSVENATAFLGGISENYNSNLILGDDKVSVVEADEFDRSFLKLSPDIACVTSMDADHLDIYEKEEHLVDSFIDFSKKVKDKILVAKGLPLVGLTYALDEDSDYKAFNIKLDRGTYNFDVKTPTNTIKNFKFSLPGKHNLMNALASIAMADIYGISHDKIRTQIESFKGVKRRFSYKVKSESFILIDDYAHHPTEISAVHNSIRELYPKQKNLVVFQPHLFSRTRDFIDDFARELSKFDEVVLLDIYPARELPISGVNSSWLLSKIKSKNKILLNKSDVYNHIKKSKAQIVAMLGAGDISDLISSVTKKIKKEFNYEV